MVSLRRILLFLSLLLLASVTAAASPVTWTLVNVTSLGSNITGSFTYDATANSYSNINVTSAGGSTIPNETWTNKATFGTFDCCLALVSSSAANETGLDLLNLDWQPGVLTNAGGTVPLVFTQQGTCAASNCVSFTPYGGDPSGGKNTAVTGYLFAPSVASPEPSSLFMLGSALIALPGLLRRRKK